MTYSLKLFIMNARTLKALCIWAKDTDRLSMPLSQAVVEFRETGKNILRTYTDPADILMFCENLVGYDPIKFFTDYVLFYNSCH